MAQRGGGANVGGGAGAGAAPAQQQALQRPVVLPPEFSNATGEDWETYQAQFDAACTVNGYGNAERLQFLPCRLKGSAFQIYQGIIQATPNIAYPQLCQALAARFTPPQQSQLLEAEFRARVKSPAETQIEYAAALQRLAMRAFPGQHGTPLFARLVLNQFIDGQASSELRLHIRAASPQDLDAAVRRALEIAAVLETEARRSSPAPALSVSAVRAGPVASESAASASSDPLILGLLNKISNQLDAFASANRTPHSSSAPSAPATGNSSGGGRGSSGVRRCWRCGSPDHLRPACPLLSTQSPASSNGQSPAPSSRSGN